MDYTHLHEPKVEKEPGVVISSFLKGAGSEVVKTNKIKVLEQDSTIVQICQRSKYAF